MKSLAIYSICAKIKLNHPQITPCPIVTFIHFKSNTRLTEQQQDASQYSQNNREIWATCYTDLALHFFPPAVTNFGLDCVDLRKAKVVWNVKEHTVRSNGEFSGQRQNYARFCNREVSRNPLIAWVCHYIDLISTLFWHKEAPIVHLYNTLWPKYTEVVAHRDCGFLQQKCNSNPHKIYSYYIK